MDRSVVAACVRPLLIPAAAMAALCFALDTVAPVAVLLSCAAMYLYVAIDPMYGMVLVICSDLVHPSATMHTHIVIALVSGIYLLPTTTLPLLMLCVIMYALSGILCACLQVTDVMWSLMVIGATMVLCAVPPTRRIIARALPWARGACTTATKVTHAYVESVVYLVATGQLHIAIKALATALRCKVRERTAVSLEMFMLVALVDQVPVRAMAPIWRVVFGTCIAHPVTGGRPHINLALGLVMDVGAQRWRPFTDDMDVLWEIQLLGVGQAE